MTQIPVDTYVLCVAFPDLVSYNSKVAEFEGQRFDDPPNQSAAAMRELHKAGTDVLQIAIDQGHEHNVEVIASVRMGDTHHRQPDPKKHNVPQFLIDHPEYQIRRQDGIVEMALDYSYPQVRSHRLAMMRELAENYDIDGLELDFVRWGKFFAREEAPFKIGLMTEFVGEVRKILDDAAKKRGRERLILGVQVLRSLHTCHLAGLEPKTWVENDWLDYLIHCDWNVTDPQLPVSEFAEFCGPSKCSHYVRMGKKVAGRWSSKPYHEGRKVTWRGIKGYGGMVLTDEEARGAAANAYGFGADGIGLWNLCCDMGGVHKPDAHEGISREEYQQDFIRWCNEVADPEKVWSGKRTYHFVPIHKSESLIVRNYAVNELRSGPLGEPVQIVMFSPESKGFRQIYRFLMADGKDGQKLRGILRLRILQSSLKDKFEFDINGEPVRTEFVCATEVPDDELPCVWYEVDLDKCPPFTGDNELGMTMTTMPTARDDLADSAKMYEVVPYMEELIIEVV